jgi:trehalose synthase-fused probable maltokinase
VATSLPGFLPGQRWFAGKGRRIRSVSLLDWGALDEAPGAGSWLILVTVEYEAGPPEAYWVPLAVAPGDATPERPVGRLDASGALVGDALDDPASCLALLAGFQEGRTIPTEQGTVRFASTGALPLRAPDERSAPRRLGAEQSNTSVVFGDALILKAFRKVAPGINPDAEVTGFLTTRTRFRHIPLLAGTIEYAGAAGLGATLGLLQQFVPNQGDGWGHTLDHLRAFHDFLVRHPEAQRAETERSRLVREFSAGHFQAVRRLGAVTGELHAALGSDPTDPAFRPEPITAEDAEGWAGDVAQLGDSALGDLRGALAGLAPSLAIRAQRLLAREPSLAAPRGALAAVADAGCRKIRIHGDYHLGQTLRTADDFAILDFEGEPARPLAERRAKHCVLKDVAGMLRSLDYAVAVALRDRPDAAAGTLHDPAAWGDAWMRGAAAGFLEGYLSEVGSAPVALVPASREAVDAALAVFELGKALYELRYELHTRPGWVGIPLGALERLLDEAPWATSP